MLRRAHISLFLLIAVSLVLVPTLSACTGSEGPQGPQGPQGPEGSPPSADAIKSLIEEVLAPGASAASIAAGGRLYDKWWAEDAGATEPTADSALWGLQATNTRSGSTTWRCKECHGWDYKGKGGAYSSGSHFTGFDGVYRAGSTMSEDSIVAALQGGTDYRHDFSGVLSPQAINNLADFLQYGLINDTLYIDYATKEPIGADAAHGKELFDQNCATCHGTDGTQINFGAADDPEYLGTLAGGNPWETVHKIMFGQPGTAMPSAIVNDWSIQDVLDVLDYSQTLPTE